MTEASDTQNAILAELRAIRQLLEHQDRRRSTTASWTPVVSGWAGPEAILPLVRRNGALCVRGDDRGDSSPEACPC
jgi:hypothetical protein